MSNIQALADAYAGLRSGRKVSMALVDGEEITYVSSSNLENARTTKFDVASVTKTVCTAYSALKLVQNNKLNFDTKISDIIPDFSHQQVTLHHLLTMTLNLDIPALSSINFEQPEQLRSLLCSSKLKAEPGSSYIYANSTSILLGYTLEAVMNMPLNKIFELLISAPMKLRDTQFSIDLSSPDEVVNTLKPNRLPHDPTAYFLAKKGLAGGHAGLISTTKDLALVLKDLLSTRQQFNEEIYDRMFNNQITQSSVKASYGWELRSSVFNTDSFQSPIFKTGHTGCLIAAVPGTGKGLVILTNSTYPKGKTTPMASTLGQQISKLWLS